MICARQKKSSRNKKFLALFRKFHGDTKKNHFDGPQAVSTYTKFCGLMNDFGFNETISILCNLAHNADKPNKSVPIELNYVISVSVNDGGKFLSLHERRNLSELDLHQLIFH
jgi:hypothetical protein